MGGEQRLRAIESVTMQGGSGSRSRLGQSIKPTDPDPRATMANVSETLDLAGHRAAMSYELTTTSGFTQRRQEVITTAQGVGIGLENVGGRPLAVMAPSALFSWGTQNSPAMLLRRNVIAVALAALATRTLDTPQDKELDGKRLKFAKTLLGDETIGVYFDPGSRLISAFEATDTEAMLGDVQARYFLDDYRNVGGVVLPHRVTIQKGGAHYSDVQFATAQINDRASLAVFDIPDAARADVEHALAEGPTYSPVAVTAVARGVYFAQAYSHHSLVVEFPSYLAVVEAPYTEAQTKTLVRLLATMFPRKPVRYAAVTHPHFDHIGGVRGMAAAGATVLVASAHAPAVQTVMNARHTNPSDDLDTRRKTGAKVGSVEMYGDTKVLTEGDQSLELRIVAGSPHADPIVLAYVPSAQLLFQSDLFFPGTGGSGTPAAVHLLQAVRRLNLNVRINAGGHGGVAPFDELVNAVGAGTR